MKIFKVVFLVGILFLISLTSVAYATPQASATATLNFTLTFKDVSGAVLDTNYLHTDWGLDIGYSLVPFVGSPIAIQPVDVNGNSSLNELSQSGSYSQGTAFGQVGLSGAYSTGTGSSTMGMSSYAEVGGGLLNARWENLSYASASLYNLCFSFGDPAYLDIDYNYSIAFNTAVVGPYWWDWSAGGLVTMTLLGGGSWYDAEGEYHFETVYPYDDPLKEVLFRIPIYSEDGKPSDSLSGSGSFHSINLYRAGLSGVGWNLTADVTTYAQAPGVEGSSTVPEPTTMLLLGLGLLGLAGIMKKESLS